MVSSHFSVRQPVTESFPFFLVLIIEKSSAEQLYNDMRTIIPITLILRADNSLAINLRSACTQILQGFRTLQSAPYTHADTRRIIIPLCATWRTSNRQLVLVYIIIIIIIVTEQKTCSCVRPACTRIGTYFVDIFNPLEAFESL